MSKLPPLRDLGLKDEDIIHCDMETLDNGEADLIFEFSEEGQAIVEAFCHREKINVGDYLKALVLCDGQTLEDLRNKNS